MWLYFKATCFNVRVEESDVKYLYQEQNKITSQKLNRVRVNCRVVIKAAINC